MTEDLQVMQIAQREAKRLGDSFVDTGHLLLGIIEDGPDLTSYLLGCSGATARSVSAQLENFSLSPRREFLGDLPWTPAVRHSISDSWDQCRMLGKSKVTKEHVLLGLLSLPEGMSLTIFDSLNVDVPALRDELIEAIKLSAMRASA